MSFSMAKIQIDPQMRDRLKTSLAPKTGSCLQKHFSNWMLMVVAISSGRRRLLLSELDRTLPSTVRSGKIKQTPIPKRSVTLDNGYRTSFTLEDEFWSALHELAQTQDKTAVEIVRQIDREHFHAINLSSAIRVFVLNHFRKLRTRNESNR